MTCPRCLAHLRLNLPERLGLPSQAEINLHVHLSDLAAEILENPTAKPGCTLFIKLLTHVNDPELDCPMIEAQLNAIWEQRPRIITANFLSIWRTSRFRTTIKSHYLSVVKYDESHLDDFSDLIDYALESLAWLDERGAA